MKVFLSILLILLLGPLGSSAQVTGPCQEGWVEYTLESGGDVATTIAGAIAFATVKVPEADMVITGTTNARSCWTWGSNNTELRFVYICDAEHDWEISWWYNAYLDTAGEVVEMGFSVGSINPTLGEVYPGSVIAETFAGTVIATRSSHYVRTLGVKFPALSFQRNLVFFVRKDPGPGTEDFFALIGTKVRFVSHRCNTT